MRGAQQGSKVLQAQPETETHLKLKLELKLLKLKPKSKLKVKIKLKPKSKHSKANLFCQATPLSQRRSLKFCLPKRGPTTRAHLQLRRSSNSVREHKPNDLLGGCYHIVRDNLPMLLRQLAVREHKPTNANKTLRIKNPPCLMQEDHLPVGKVVGERST